jgi:hypothetical protein
MKKDHPMQIDKSTILDLLRQQGDDHRAEQAERELPDQVDPQADSSLLERFGINPMDLIGKFTGGGGIPGL